MAFVSAQQLQHSIILSGALLLGSKPLGKHGDQQLIHALEPAAVNAALKREQRDILRNGGGLSNLGDQCSGVAQPNPADSIIMPLSITWNDTILFSSSIHAVFSALFIQDPSFLSNAAYRSVGNCFKMKRQCPGGHSRIPRGLSETGGSHFCCFVCENDDRPLKSGGSRV